MVSRVLAATPPSLPEAGEGRMKAHGSLASRAMRVLSPRIDPPVGRRGAGQGRQDAHGAVGERAVRVLSPRIDPPVRREEGSTVSTATLWPFSVRKVPSASMVVDFPTPGMPVMPTRTALPVAG